MRCAVFLLSLFSISSSFAQFLEQKNIPFFIQGKELLNPTTGGLNNPQLSMIDLNFDGFQDIFVFDRHGDVAIPMLYNPVLKSYLFNYELKNAFPKLYDWVILKDYNYDKIPDIFSGSLNNNGAQGVEVYTGYIKNNKLAFRIATNGKGNKLLMWNTGSSGETQIYVSQIDIPTVDDVDNDGDLDILSFGNGASHVEYYKNIAVERGWSKDSLIFIQQSDCYGGFKEGGFTGDIFLSIEHGGCNRFQTNQTRHAGSTLLSTDLNVDGLRDLLIGDLSSNRLVAVYNGGSLSNAWMNQQDPLWNSITTSVNVPVFVAPFEIDANQDGIKDIVACPNNINTSINSNNIFLFNGRIEQGKLIQDITTKSFLVDEMLDFGAGSYPCFVDYNQDGLTDLLIGTEGEFITSNTRTGGLILFENKGTKIKPQFHLVDSNYLNFQKFSIATMGVRSFTPTFGDLDGDGDQDMLVGESDGKLFYCENIAGANKPFIFKSPIYGYKNIKVNAYNVPFIVDLNRDGLLDIICGSKLSNSNANGDLCSGFTYFQNQGTRNSPFFEADPKILPNTECVGNAILDFVYYSHGTPFIYDFKGKYKLFTGNDMGNITVFEDIENNIYSQFKKVSSNYGSIREGNYVSISLADLDSDGILDMAVGNIRGGISIYSTDYLLDGTKVVTKNPNHVYFELFPNPVSNYFVIQSDEDVQLELVVCSLSGQFSIQKQVLTNSNIDISELNAGVYLVKFSYKEKQIIQKLIKI